MTSLNARWWRSRSSPCRRMNTAARRPLRRIPHCALPARLVIFRLGPSVRRQSARGLARPSGGPSCDCLRTGRQAARGKPGPPMTLANMRLNGVHMVTATCEAYGREADINVDALPESMHAPHVGRRLRCSNCGGKRVWTNPRGIREPTAPERLTIGANGRQCHRPSGPPRRRHAARRPKLRARSHPCIVPLKRG